MWNVYLVITYQITIHPRMDGRTQYYLEAMMPTENKQCPTRSCRFYAKNEVQWINEVQCAKKMKYSERHGTLSFCEDKTPLHCWWFQKKITICVTSLNIGHFLLVFKCIVYVLYFQQIFHIKSLVLGASRIFHSCLGHQVH